MVNDDQGTGISQERRSYGEQGGTAAAPAQSTNEAKLKVVTDELREQIATLCLG